MVAFAKFQVELLNAVVQWVTLGRIVKHVIKNQKKRFIYKIYKNKFIDNDPCTSRPCLNAGVCTSNPATNSYSCNCGSLYSGFNCGIGKRLNIQLYFTILLVNR